MRSYEKEEIHNRYNRNYMFVVKRLRGDQRRSYYFVELSHFTRLLNRRVYEH